jgi:trimethyllysine dioxygenase
MNIESVCFEHTLDVVWASGEVSHYSFMWLRDNARDERSFDARTHQREVFTASLDSNIKPLFVERRNAGALLSIQWELDCSPIEYTSTFLYRYRQPVKTQTIRGTSTLWDRDVEPPVVDYPSLSDSTQTDQFLTSMIEFGFVLVRGCPTDLSSVNALAEQLGYVRETIFGGVWSFEADEAMADSAYTPRELRPHTDGSYSLDAPGVQILLCLEQSASGGESILVDGFAIAEKVRREHPEIYKYLCRIEVEGMYQGDGVTLLARRPILRLNASGELEQVTFNNYDRNVMRLADDQMQQLYDGIRLIDGLFNDPQYQWRHQLQAGEAIVLDNWRLLHGRSAYVGSRKLAGAYVNREDFISRLGLND